MLKKFGEFELDTSLRKLSRGDRPVRLTGQALDLLCLLVNRPGELLCREEIKGRLWPDSNVEFQHTLDVLVNRLRVILGDRGKSPRYIETVPRRGYRFLPPVDEERPSRRQLSRSSLAGRLWAYAAIALLAASIALLIVRTRYEKFIPPEHTPVSASPSRRAK